MNIVEKLEKFNIKISEISNNLNVSEIVLCDCLRLYEDQEYERMEDRYYNLFKFIDTSSNLEIPDLQKAFNHNIIDHSERNNFANNKIWVNSIMKNPSLCDGYGYRTVLFLQGCNLKCKGCQNTSTWNIEDGELIDIEELANHLKKRVINNKLTISGGEPLMQKESLMNLLIQLKDFDLCLYTGHFYDAVPINILKYLKYIKVGPFKLELKTTMKPFIGSSNQEFIEVEKYEKTKQKW